MNAQMIGYLALRRLIGIIGVAFPFVLLIAKVIQEPGSIPGSISDYYYATDLTRSILVGALCAIGFFLSTYRGYDKDYIPVRMAALFAVGVAFFPTIPANPTSFNNVIGIFHGIFAGLMFLSLAYISYFLFTKTNKYQTISEAYNAAAPATRGRNLYVGLSTRRKRQRNVVYRTCGIIMAVAMLLIYPLTHWIHVPQAMYWLETIIVVAFGISWLVKGETILKDKA
jgi:hypothetical protein